VLWDYGGELQEWTVEPALEVELPGQTVLGVRQWTSFERFAGIDFRPTQAAVYGDTSWLDWLSTEVFYRWGTGINYYPPGGIAPFLGNAQEVQASATFRPTSRLRLDETYLFSSLTVGGHSSLPASLSGADIFNNHIVRSRVNYQFTKRLSTRLIVVYEAVLPNETLVSLEREKRLAFDVLATYMVNPWTAVYVGYTDAYANLLLEDPLERPVTRGGAPTTSVGRQLFVKVSYLLKY
jgi:hypothetical protein